MENQSTPTLNRFFAVKELAGELYSRIVDSDQFRPIRRKLQKQLKGIPLTDGLWNEIFQEVNKLLNIDLRAILINAWGASKELIKYTNPKKYPPDETILIPLAKHTVVSEHHPSIRPTVNGVSVGDITFDVVLELALEGVILRVEQGRIMGFTIGACKAKGTLDFGEFSLLKKEGKIPELGGTVRFEKGIPFNEPVEKIHTALKVVRTMGVSEPAS
ncbi:MAG: hypothetical protein D6681_02745 [Calditrichaeota bacterium]|nr:MAG: hypothetical protein D6681_02745 [Calditrichota bacterium]